MSATQGCLPSINTPALPQWTSQCLSCAPVGVSSQPSSSDKTEAPRDMKLNPQQAPLYGRCVITVQLADEELDAAAKEEEGVDFFLLFAGSTQRHLTSTFRSSHDTLQALCPAHDCCEVVSVTLCSASRGVPESPENLKPCLGRVSPLAEHRFSFVQDVAFDMAQFLVSTAGRADGLDGALLLDECQISLQECERLDESLALALQHLALPPGWSLLGNKLPNSNGPNPQETLLHFSAHPVGRPMRRRPPEAPAPQTAGSWARGSRAADGAGPEGTEIDRVGKGGGRKIRNARSLSPLAPAGFVMSRLELNGLVLNELQLRCEASQHTALALLDTELLTDFLSAVRFNLLWIFKGKMYERHKRRYSLRAKGERAVDVVLIKIHRDREASFHQPCNTQHSESSGPPALPSLPSRTSSATSCPSAAHTDSGSDFECLLNAEPGHDSVFRKNDEPVTGRDGASEVSVSCSSTDDAASVGPSSSSPEGSQGPECSWSPEEAGPAIAAGLDSVGVGDGGAGEAAEEAKDRVTEVPRRSSILRNSIRSLSPLRRHSWGPGKNNGGDAEMNQRSSTRSAGEGKPTFHRRSYSLEGLSGAQEELRGPATQGPRIQEPSRMPRHDGDDRGSLVSRTVEQEVLGQHGRLQDLKSRRYRPLRNSCPPMTLPLTKSVSMLAISQRDIDGLRSFGSASGSLAYSISEEEPGPLRSDTDGKSTTKVSRTFSYLKNKMYKKTREKDREKREKDKEKDKKAINGHLFTPVSSGPAAQCSQCNKAFNSKEAFQCTHCNASVHKSCRDSLPICAKVKMKQFAVPDSSSFTTVTMRNKSGGTRERPWSAILSPEDHSSLMIPSRRHTSIMAFHGNNLSKSLSISNIAGPVFDEMPTKGLRYLSQSTDSLNRTNQVTESMESLTDEGTEMMDGQLMGEFEAEAKELEADSWSLCAEQQYLQQLDKDLAKRQDVIYELMQTEMHHIRTLRIMSEVFSKGLQKEVQLELQTVEKLFPALDELLELHSQHLLRLLERKRESQLEGHWQKEKDEDEGIPSETEDDKRQLETKAKEMRGLLRQKDTEILSLLEEKVQLFRGMWEPLNPGEEVYRQVQPFFRSACSLEPPRGASIMSDALQEVETLQGLVNGSLGGAMASVQDVGGGGAGPVCLPRRAETFGGFDSHQMHSSKSGDGDESEDAAGDLRRTESDSVLKKGGNANMLLLLKRNSEVLHSVSNLHLLLSTLQAVVVQQDSFIEDQRQALSERSSSSASLSRPSSRPSSLIEQEKQRSLEKQRQELASLQRQQAAHAEEKRRREKEWETREQQLTEREGQVHLQEEEVLKRQKELEEEKHGLQSRKEEYQKDLERLRDAQRKLERDREAVQRQLDKMEELRLSEGTPSTTSDESQIPSSAQSLELDLPELSSSSSSSSSSSQLRLQPQRSKPKGRGLNPFTSSSINLRGGEANSQLSKSMLQLAKSKSKEEKEKKKKKGKGGSTPEADPSHLPEPPLDGEIFFC
ncbi:A-kinase anchor protein 13-like [Pseudoliparis swirei]|uniref:A-kinase anchor protein 13-like n=1 Tax=Pseudoliparis swirei TaxID=2059687 RepID=UPI0024BDE762|nr:A-kinase anchor protein 13-like [Pseudoliparis swirei]